MLGIEVMPLGAIAIALGPVATPMLGTGHATFAMLPEPSPLATMFLLVILALPTFTGMSNSSSNDKKVYEYGSASAEYSDDTNDSEDGGDWHLGSQPLIHGDPWKFNLAYHDYRRNEVENWRVKEEWGKKEEGER
ncbi:hypothetical protein FNV43_RR19388 [Rhamnella rubrinervis]|uniref:Uncharacterized protein n=1 Tax=Rhamnella rubrinervis TaxID=2594499 RepID=A0A8K0E4E0_9ROSA|nr:hypothetical protein FNV43_RR19388 [Rhamnella rubrinervis]